MVLPSWPFMVEREFESTYAERSSWSPAAALCPVREVKKQATEVRAGEVLDYEGRLFQVVKKEHTQGSGRQLGNVQFQLRDVKQGTKRQDRKRSYDTVEVAQMEHRSLQYLYSEDDKLFFMDPDSFQQETLAANSFGEQGRFLQEGMMVEVSYFKGEAITGEVPNQIEVTVEEAGVYTRGNTAGSDYQPVQISGGATVQAPPYVAAGQKIIISTADGSFVRRSER
ncbi:hypothetical protein WJX74_008226 [Apatococcus lobatus]|uniref:Elongation factor P n=1 Tax=Apatococcus lobatus TaxID=904363 RepID=A0AAW1S4K6_9CHLO